jgi:Fe-S cluster biogenesis protein NfuA
MDHRAVSTAVDEMASLLRQDGADLRLVRIDEKIDRIELALDIEDANCVDCILPPAVLLSTVDAALRRRIVQEFEVLIDDPRLAS